MDITEIFMVLFTFYCRANITLSLSHYFLKKYCESGKIQELGGKDRDI